MVSRHLSAMIYRRLYASLGINYRRKGDRQEFKPINLPPSKGLLNASLLKATLYCLNVSFLVSSRKRKKEKVKPSYICAMAVTRRNKLRKFSNALALKSHILFLCHILGCIYQQFVCNVFFVFFDQDASDLTGNSQPH